MQNVCWSLLVSLFLGATPTHAAELIAYIPDDSVDPSSAPVSLTVRPTQRISIAAAVFDRDPRDNGLVAQNHSGDELTWQPSCNASSPACPKVETGAGAVATIIIPSCMPLGQVTFRVTYQGMSSNAVVLTNTEEGTVCAEDDTAGASEPYMARSSATEGARSGRGSYGGGGYGGGDSRGANGRTWGASRFDSFSAGEGSYGGGHANSAYDPYRPPAIVMECTRRVGSGLICQNVDDLRAARRYAQRILRQRSLAKKATAKNQVKKIMKPRASGLARR